MVFFFTSFLVVPTVVSVINHDADISVCPERVHKKLVDGNIQSRMRILDTNVNKYKKMILPMPVFYEPDAPYEWIVKMYLFIATK